MNKCVIKQFTCNQQRQSLDHCACLEIQLINSENYDSHFGHLLRLCLNMTQHVLFLLFCP